MVISFIVEAFVLQLEEANHRKEREKQLLGRNLQIVYDTDCVEGIYRQTSRKCMCSKVSSKSMYDVRIILRDYISYYCCQAVLSTLLFLPVVYIRTLLVEM